MEYVQGTCSVLTILWYIPRGSCKDALIQVNLIWLLNSPILVSTLCSVCTRGKLVRQASNDLATVARLYLTLASGVYSRLRFHYSAYKCQYQRPTNSSPHTDDAR